MGNVIDMGGGGLDEINGKKKYDFMGDTSIDYNMSNLANGQVSAPSSFDQGIGIDPNVINSGGAMAGTGQLGTNEWSQPITPVFGGNSSSSVSPAITPVDYSFTVPDNLFTSIPSLNPPSPDAPNATGVPVSGTPSQDYSFTVPDLSALPGMNTQPSPQPEPGTGVQPEAYGDTPPGVPDPGGDMASTGVVNFPSPGTPDLTPHSKAAPIDPFEYEMPTDIRALYDEMVARGAVPEADEYNFQMPEDIKAQYDQMLARGQLPGTSSFNYQMSPELQNIYQDMMSRANQLDQTGEFTFKLSSDLQQIYDGMMGRAGTLEGAGMPPELKTEFENIMMDDAKSWDSQQKSLQDRTERYQRMADLTNARLGRGVGGGYAALTGAALAQGMNEFNQAALQHSSQRRQMQLGWLDKVIDQKNRNQELAAREREGAQNLYVGERRGAEDRFTEDQRWRREQALGERRSAEDLLLGDRNRSEDIWRSDTQRTEDIARSERQRAEDFYTQQRTRSEDMFRSDQQRAEDIARDERQRAADFYERSRASAEDRYYNDAERRQEREWQIEDQANEDELRLLELYNQYIGSVPLGENQGVESFDEWRANIG